MGASVSWVKAQIQERALLAVSGLSAKDYQDAREISRWLKDNGKVESDFSDLQKELNDCVDTATDDNPRAKPVESLTCWYPDRLNDYIKTREELLAMTPEDCLENNIMFSLCTQKSVTSIAIITEPVRWALYERVLPGIIGKVPFEINMYTHNNVNAIVYSQLTEQMKTINDPNVISLINKLNLLETVYIATSKREKTCSCINDPGSVQLISSLGYQVKPGWFGLFVTIVITDP
jgi:hypothetical protein